MRWLNPGGVQVGRLLGLQQLGVEGARGHQEAQAQAGGQHLGERAQVDAAFRVAGGERQRRGLVEPEVAVGVVLHQRQAQLGGFGRQRCAARLGHRAARGVLEVGQQIHEARAVRARAHLGGQVVHQRAFVVARHAVHVGLHGREGLQGAEVGRGFHQHAASRVDEHLGHQVQALLRAGGDQDLVGRHVPGQEIRHGLAQRQVALARGVLQRGGSVVAQHRRAGLREVIDREGLGEGRPPARLMMPGFSVTFRISRITEGFIFAARRARVQVVMEIISCGRPVEGKAVPRSCVVIVEKKPSCGRSGGKGWAPPGKELNCAAVLPGRRALRGRAARRARGGR